MPRFDGKGPINGQGYGFGRGIGRGRGFFGRGFGRGFGIFNGSCIRTDAERLEALEDYKKTLEAEMADVKKAEEELRKAA